MELMSGKNDPPEHDKAADLPQLPAVFEENLPKLREDLDDVLADPIKRAKFVVKTNRGPELYRETVRSAIGEMTLKAEAEAKKQQRRSRNARVISVLGGGAVAGGIVAIATAPVSIPLLLVLGGGATAILAGELTSRKMESNASKLTQKAERYKQVSSQIRSGSEPPQLEQLSPQDE